VTSKSLPALVTAALIALLFLKVLSSHQWDPRAFVLETPAGVAPDRGWGVGYDGRFSYALAVNPLGSTQGLDQPAFRYQRLVFPLIVRVMSLNQPAWAPWMMMALNLIAAGWACIVLGELLSRRGVSRWLALAFVISFGFLLAARLDLLEPLTFALALTGWLLYEQGRIRLAILCFALSGLTKEVGLMFPAALVCWEGMRRNWRRALAVLLGSFGPYVVWYVFLYLTFGRPPIQALQSSLILIPFAGIYYIRDPVSLGFVIVFVLLPAFAGGVSAAWYALRRRADDSTRDAFLVMTNAALVSVMPLPTWEDPLAVARIGLGVVAALLLWLAGSHKRALPLVTALYLPSGILLALAPGML
jgi:hypothetical protein